MCRRRNLNDANISSSHNQDYILVNQVPPSAHQEMSGSSAQVDSKHCSHSTKEFKFIKCLKLYAHLWRLPSHTKLIFRIGIKYTFQWIKRYMVWRFLQRVMLVLSNGLRAVQYVAREFHTRRVHGLQGM